MYYFKIRFLLLITLFTAISFRTIAQEAVIPKYHTKQILVDPDDEEDLSYLGFPSLLRLDKDHILISFKRGNSHGGGHKAVIDMLHFNTENNQIMDQKTIASDPTLVQQMGEWVQFPNGEIAIYIDTQQTGHDNDNYRVGMREVRLKKNGGYFTASETKRAPLVDGREYGYPLNFIVDGNTTYMLVMAFGYRPGGRWSVDVIKSKDNGKS